jgi:hypothetical protein
MVATLAARVASGDVHDDEDPEDALLTITGNAVNSLPTGRAIGGLSER